MKPIKEIVATNLVNLRKQNNLKQSELAEKINYTNKAISRWEKGEVIPNLEILEQLAVIYNVPTSYFLEEHVENELNKTNKLTDYIYISALLSMVLVVWTVATIVFLALKTYINLSYPLIFMWAVPISMYVVSFCIGYRFKAKYFILTASVSLWTTILAIYFQLLHLNIWTIFLLGIPIQITIILIYFVRKIKEQKPKQKKK